MTIDQLPGEITIPTRVEIKDRYLNSYRIRQPDADVGDNTQPDLDASIFSDQLLTLYAHAKVIGQNSVLEESRGQATDDWAARELGENSEEGERQDASGATGFVTIQGATGGGTIFEGDEVREPNKSIRFQCRVTDLYTPGQQVPISGLDTGPETNLAPNTPMVWTSPRPGIAPDCVVAEQETGVGLSNGRVAESDQELIDRIKLEKRTRAASGNDAEYQLATEKTPTVPVQKAFTYPAILGPGTTAIAFTLRPASPGASRVPSSAQIAEARLHLQQRFPADDGQFLIDMVAEPSDVVYSIEFDETASGFVDLVPWPPYQAPSAAPGAIVVDTVTDALTFSLKTDDSDYTGQVQPIVGQTIAFYDQATATFKHKRLKTIGGTGPWSITVETLNAASDENFVPVVGQRAMPWSESLDLIATGVIAAFEALGPGEMFATFFDAGLRQRRNPRAPRDFPQTITNKALTDALEIDQVSDGDVLEGASVSPTVGTPAVLVNIVELGRISAFPI